MTDFSHLMTCEKYRFSNRNASNDADIVKPVSVRKIPTFTVQEPFCPNVVPAPESHRSVATLAPDREVVAQSYPIRTVIQFSKYNWGGICQDRKFDLSAKRKIKSRHISTLIIGESFALASNQMLICDGFELFKRPYCLRRLNSTLNSTKTAVASHGTLRKENTAGIADWCLTIPLRRHHIQLYTS